MSLTLTSNLLFGIVAYAVKSVMCLECIGVYSGVLKG